MRKSLPADGFDFSFIKSFCREMLSVSLWRPLTSEQTRVNLFLALLHLPAGADCRTKEALTLDAATPP